MPGPADHLRHAADRYLQAQSTVQTPAELPPRLKACAAHLAAGFGCTRAQADEAALLAWSEIAGRRTGCYVDLEASTPTLIYLVDAAAGVSRPIPVVDQSGRYSGAISKGRLLSRLRGE